MTNKSDIIWHNETRRLSDLIPVSYNPRKLSKKERKDLKKSLCKFNLAEVPVINTDSTILAGHQRCKILAEIENKDFEIDVRVPNRKLTKEESDEYLIRSNKNTGEFDFELLVENFEIDDLVDFGFNEEDFDFTEPEEIGEIEGEDDIPEPPKEPITKRGDVWILGNHRLLCGDATSIDDVDKLMDFEKADMVFTDPPYGINIVSKDGSVGGGTKGKYQQIKGDDTTNAAIESFTLCQSLNIPVQFFWGANYYSSNLPDSPCWIVWDKQGGKSINFTDCELCYTNIKSPVRMFTHIWDGFRKDSEKGEMRVHPTQKPVKLFIDIWDKFDCPNTVLDLFGGSGSTLIACEKTKRKCFMMEIEPRYCNIIVTRWQEFTGNSAILEETGECYG